MEWLFIIIFILSVITFFFYIESKELKLDLIWVRGELNNAVHSSHEYAKQAWEANDKLIDLTSLNIELENKLNNVIKAANGEI